MLVFLLYIVFVYSFDGVFCGKQARRQAASDSYMGAVKSAKLIRLVQQMKDFDDRSDPNNALKDGNLEDPSIYQSMKLLQKNYDTNKQFNEENNKDRVQYLSNPEVLNIYKNKPSRREDDDEEDTPYSYKDEALRSGLLSMHFLSNPGVLKDYRRLINKESTSSSSESSDIDDVEDSSSGDIRRRIKKQKNTKKKMKDLNIVENLEDNLSQASSDGTDVTMKLEETFDIVKPFVVEIFNKLKEKKYTKDTNTRYNIESNNFVIENKASDNELLEKEDIEKNIIDKLFEINTKDTIKVPEDYTESTTEPYVENPITEKQDNKKEKKSDDEIVTKDSWRKKEKVKYSQEVKKEAAEDAVYDKDWSKKKLPASKKSFVEPSLIEEDINKAYRNSRDRNGKNDELQRDNWNDEEVGWKKKENSWGKKKKKDDFDAADTSNKKDSWENKKDSNTSKKKKNEDKSWNNKKKDWGQYDNEKKIDDVESDKQKKKKDDWEKKEDNWNKKEDNWKKKKIEWGKKEDDWKEDDDRHKKKDDWDKDDDDRHKKNDDWNKDDDDRHKKKDDWNKHDGDRHKKKDDWNKKDDWDKNDLRDKKKNDWNKKDDDWDNKDDKWNNKKKDDWDKKEDNWEKKKDDWDKKDDDWNKKDDKWKKKDDNSKEWDKKDEDINWEKKKEKEKLPDNLNRDHGWDMVGVEKKKESSWSNYDNYQKKNKPESYEKTNMGDDKPLTKHKNTNEWDRYKPNYPVHYDKPQNSHKYNSHEKGGAQSNSFGRTPIPFVGSKSVYDK